MYVVWTSGSPNVFSTLSHVTRVVMEDTWITLLYEGGYIQRFNTTDCKVFMYPTREEALADYQNNGLIAQ